MLHLFAGNFCRGREDDTTVALEGSAYPSEAQKVASVMRMESSAISWPPSRNGSNWRYSGQYGILLDASRGMMSRNPPNLFPSFSFLFQGLLSMSSTAAKSKCFARNL